MRKANEEFFPIAQTWRVLGCEANPYPYFGHSKPEYAIESIQIPLI